ncbi:MAG: hypothetical protein LBC99_04585 [Spirochaetota bacterium]|nr:hypothetical protein [Spirochaetota bacterium]
MYLSFRSGKPAIFLLAALFFSPTAIYAFAPNPYPQFSAHGSLRLDGSLDSGDPDAMRLIAGLAAEITGALTPHLSMGVIVDSAQIALQSVYTSTNILAALRYETDPARILGSVIWYAPFGVELEGCLTYSADFLGGAAFLGQAGFSLNDILGLRDALYALTATGGVSLSAQGSVLQTAIYGASSEEFLPLFSYNRQTRSEDGMAESESRLDISGVLFSVCAWNYSHEVYRSSESFGAFRSQCARVCLRLLEEAPVFAQILSLSAGGEWSPESASSVFCRFGAESDSKRKRAIDIQITYRRESVALSIVDVQAVCQYSWAGGVRAMLRYDAVFSALPEHNAALAVSLSRRRAVYQTELAYHAQIADAAYWKWRHSLSLGAGESWAFRALFDWTPPTAMLTLSLAYQI